jgi:phosphoglycerate dehydrogenase-like enzyme
MRLPGGSRSRSDTLRVALLDDYLGVALTYADWSALPNAEVHAYTDHQDDEDAIVERLRDYHAVVLMRERTPFRRALIERLPALRLIVTTGARNASIDLAAAQERDIVVCGTRSLNYPTAELTWGLILALLRHIPREDAAVRRGSWQTALGVGVQGKALGVLGLGNLGSQVATVGRAFGMDVVAWSQNLTAERCEAVGARLVTKDELFATSDVVTIHLVLSDRTRGLVGASELALMRPTSYLVNTSRGPIVDEAALIPALTAGTIAGAALDVYDTEPLPHGHPLLGLDNVVLTPHVGYVTREGYELFYSDALEDVRAFMDGSPIRVIGD